MNILIIEDNRILCNSLIKCFDSNSFANLVNVIHSYDDFLYNSCFYFYDVILLDICLWNNNLDGIKILKHIREQNTTIPVIIMSWYDTYSLLDEAFSLWAHDYIIKPFRNKELQIRIKRWFRNYIFFEYHSQSDVLRYNDLIYDLNTCEFYLQDKRISLSKSSKYLLLLLLVNKEKLVKKEYLSSKIWGSEAKQHSVRVKVLRLKKYLDSADIAEWICTVRGEWYMLRK